MNRASNSKEAQASVNTSSAEKERKRNLSEESKENEQISRTLCGSQREKMEKAKEVVNLALSER